MNVNKYGSVILDAKDFFEAAYSGKIKNLTDIFLNEPDAREFNLAVNTNKDDFGSIEIYQDPKESIEFFDEANQCEWFMPEEYKDFPIHQWLLDQCNTELEKTRVDQELELFIQHGMFDLLFYLKYLVDTMRKNNIVWGVGRGSSVASYVLFLLGVHKIDSIKYDLDIKEFLKGETDGKI